MATKYISPTGSNGAAGTSGAPWQTLAYAVTNTSAGDTIICLDGTYTLVNQTLSYRTIQAANTRLAIFDAGGSGARWQIGASVTIVGLVFQNVVNGYNANALLGPSNGGTMELTLTNCVFKSIEMGGYFFSPLIGTTTNMSGTNTLTIQGCLFQDIQCSATGVSSSQSWLFAFNGTASPSLAISLLGNTFSFKTGGSKAIQGVFATNGMTPTATLKNNIFYNSTGGTITYLPQGGMTSAASYCDFYLITSNPTGTGVITSDPLFVDAANANFKLRPTSPCRNAGVNV